MMGENSHYGSWNSDSGESISLGELLTGDRSFSKKRINEVSIKKAAKMALKNYREKPRSYSKKVLKNIVNGLMIYIQL